MSNRKLTVAACFVVFLMGTMARAQTAQIVGTISDSSGARVPDAKVTATQVNTSVAHTVSSNPEGYYIIPLLPPGNYTVVVEKPGFQNVTHAGLALAVGENATVDVALSVGAVNQTVAVTAVAPLIDTRAARSSVSLISSA